MTDLENREAFEKWYKEEDPFHGNDDNDDVIWAKKFMFKAWQASAQRQGFKLAPLEPSEEIIKHMTNTPIEVNLLCDNADIFLSEDEALIAYKAMINAV